MTREEAIAKVRGVIAHLQFGSARARALQAIDRFVHNRVASEERRQARGPSTRTSASAPEAEARVDESITKVVGDPPAQKPSDRAMAVSVGCIFQVIGISVFGAGCGLLLAVLGGYRRPLRTLGIGMGTAPEIALLLIALGLLIALLGDMPVRELLDKATRYAPPDEPADKTDLRSKHEEGARPEPRSS